MKIRRILPAFPSIASKRFIWIGAGTIFFVCLLLANRLLAVAQPGDQFFEVSATKYMLGTKVEFKAMAPDILAAKKAFYYAYREIERVEGLLSSHRDSSEISAINLNAGVAPVKVSWETLAIVERAQEYAARFDGLFDVTIGAVTTLWGFNDDRDIAIPRHADLAAARHLVDYHLLRFSEVDTTVFLTGKGMRIDLGGIAKGYAIDRAVATLKAHGLTRFLVNAGGDIYAAGLKAEDEMWRVGIQHPRKPGELLATFQTQDMAVATSGDYERYKIIDGHRYHHIIDPRTGFPGTLNQSVSVFTSSAEKADVWATYLFILGAHDFRRMPSPPGIEVCFVQSSGAAVYDSSLVKNVHLQFIDGVTYSKLTRE